MQISIQTYRICLQKNQLIHSIIDYRKEFKASEISKIVGVHVNTITKVRKVRKVVGFDNSN